MSRLLFASVTATLLVAVTASADDKTKKPVPMIGHMVYFKLKDNSPAAKKKLTDACTRYLSAHKGTVFFAAGVLAEDFKRDVNDQDWDVALHLVFADKEAHDKYQDHPDHLKFIAENKDNWAKVRVYDSRLPEQKVTK